MMQFFNSTSTAVGDAWCRMMHSDPMWPVNGEYQCRTCFRKFRVAWEEHALPQPVPKQKASPATEAIAAASVQSL
jgi:hypothetical protein